MSLAQLSEHPGKVETLIQSGPYIHDPLLAFQHLCADSAHSLLLESAEIDSKDNLKSLLLVDAAIKLECNGQQVICQALSDNGRAVLPLFVEHAPEGVKTELNEQLGIVVMTFPSSPQGLDEDARLKAPAVFDALRLVTKKISALREHPHGVFLGGAFAYDLLASFESLPQVEEQ